MPRRAALDYNALAAAMPDVDRWHRHLLARSPDRARIDMNNLLRTLNEFRGLKPAALLEMPQNDLDDFMQDYAAFFRAKGLAGSTVSKYVDSVKSYLTWHRKQLGRPLYIEGAEQSPVAEAQEIPTQQQIQSLLTASDIRCAFIVAMEAFTGVRPQVLGKTDASDGLRLKHFLELEVTDNGLRFSHQPTVIKVPKHLSKTRKAYLTFLGPQGCEIALLYWRTRREAGEQLGPESPALVNAERGEPRILHRTNIQTILRFRLRKVGIQATTYILRSYFDNRLMVAEVHGVPSSYRDFWMGRKGGLQARYALNKEVLPPDTTESMRQAYSKALPLLETGRALPSTTPPVHQPDKTADALVRLLQAAMGLSSPPKRVRQKIVSHDKIDYYLAKGWTVRFDLGDGECIVEKTD